MSFLDNHSNISRRTMLKGMAAGAAAFAFGSGLPATAFSQSKKTNFVYILLDDAGYGDLSCYGQKLFETPNIDRIAAEGVRFTSHYSGSTVCAPSRYCLLTGVHTGHAAVRGNREFEPEGQWPLPEDSVTIGKLLKGDGYKTGAFGKWGLGSTGTTGDPNNQGFDEFFGYKCQRKAHNYYPEYVWQNNEKIELDGKTYTHDLVVEQAFDFIKQNSTAPFFCYLPVAIPHAAMQVPEESWKPFAKKFKKFKNRVGVYDAGGPLTDLPARFAGMMTRLDGQVGQLVSLLQELGIDGDTMVMLASDNGPHQEGGHMPDLFHSNGPFRGYKRDLYEGGIRVPMIARQPGVIPAGTTTDHVSAFWDVMPTMCEAAGIAAPAKIDGISMLPTLRGDEKSQREHDYLYWEFHERGGSQAVRKGNWKAVRTEVSKNPDAPVELFDLSNDPGEKNDIAAGNAGVANEMLGLMAGARTVSDEFKLFE